jgi:hypothetical protein
MLTIILLLAACALIIFLLWAWYLENEKRLDAEARVAQLASALQTSDVLARESARTEVNQLAEMLRLRGWLEWIKKGAKYRSEMDELGMLYTLRVEIPQTCDEALDGKPVPIVAHV